MNINGPMKFAMKHGVAEKHDIQADLQLVVSDFLAPKNVILQISLERDRIIREVYEVVCTQLIPNFLTAAGLQFGVPPEFKVRYQTKIMKGQYSFDPQQLAVQMALELQMKISGNMEASEVQALYKGSPGFAAIISGTVLRALREEFHVPAPKNENVSWSFRNGELTRFAVRSDKAADVN